MAEQTQVKKEVDNTKVKEDNKPTSIVERLKKLEEENKELKQKETNKKTSKSKFFKKIIDKKLKVTEIPILYLRNNGKTEIIYASPKNNLIEIEGNVHHLKPGTDWEIDNGKDSKRMIIQPEWSLYPMGSQSYIEELKGDELETQMDMIRAIEYAEVVRGGEDKKKGGKIDPKIAIIGVIILVVIIYFVSKGGA